MSEVTKECRLCGSTGPHKTIVVREMQLGFRDPFEYYSCAACDTLQIVNVLGPDELAPYYPPNYYAYNVPDRAPWPLQWILTQYIRYRLHISRRPVGALVTALLPEAIVNASSGGGTIGMLARLALNRDAQILDVGCGGGALLDQLAIAGFNNLSGADPFIEKDGETSQGVPLMKSDLNDLAGEFDLIMFHHSLEHVPDLVATLGMVRGKLAPGGVCLARLPTTSSEAWDIYGANWFQIDAPRHIVIPSRRGMTLAAEKAGLRVEKTFDDSNLSQFVFSEAYRRDVALPDIKMLRMFGLKQIWHWAKRAEQLNRQGRGDQAGFILQVN